MTPSRSPSRRKSEVVDGGRDVRGVVAAVLDGMSAVWCGAELEVTANTRHTRTTATARTKQFSEHRAHRQQRLHRFSALAAERKQLVVAALRAAQPQCTRMPNWHILTGLGKRHRSIWPMGRRGRGASLNNTYPN